MQMSFGKARVWEETVTIPTYGVGTPNKNPMFLEKRVYQGSSGRVYPHPVTDKIFDEKADRAYRALFLENDFIRVTLGYMTKSSYNCYFDFDALGGTVLTLDTDNNVTAEIVPF